MHATIRSFRFRAAIAAGAALLVAAAAGCQSRPPLSSFTWLDPASSGAGTRLTPDARRRLVADLRPGDVIMGAKHDPTSILMRLAMDESSFYTHSGIIDVRNGVVVVSHASGRFELFHRSPRLLGKVVGEVSSVSLETFIRAYADVRIVRLPDEEKNRELAMLTRAAERQGVRFDPFFDTTDPESVHCSEYTLRALQSVGYDHWIDLAERTPNASMATLLLKLGVTADRFVPVDAFGTLPGVRTVAVVSRFDRAETRLAFIDGVHVLHERVTRDPALRVGDLVGCSPSRLMHFTPTVDAYFRAIVGLAEASPQRDPGAIRERSEQLYEIVGVAGTQAVSAAGEPSRPQD